MVTLRPAPSEESPHQFPHSLWDLPPTGCTGPIPKYLLNQWSAACKVWTSQWWAGTGLWKGKVACEMLQGKTSNPKQDFSLISRTLTMSVKNTDDWSTVRQRSWLIFCHHCFSFKKFVITTLHKIAVLVISLAQNKLAFRFFLIKLYGPITTLSVHRLQAIQSLLLPV